MKGNSKTDRLAEIKQWLDETEFMLDDSLVVRAKLVATCYWLLTQLRHVSGEGEDEDV